jgi:hypothetical protein
MRQRSQEAAEQIENEIPDAAHVLFDVVAKNPEEPHIAGNVHDAAMHEHAGQQREIDGERRFLEARSGDDARAFLGLDLDLPVLRHDVRAGHDFLRHRREGHREAFVHPRALQQHKNQHVDNDQPHRHDRKGLAVAVVVAKGKDHRGPDARVISAAILPRAAQGA